MLCWVRDQADRNSIVALELSLETVAWLCAHLSYSESNQWIRLCLHLCDGGEVRWAAVTRKLSGWALSFTLQQSNPSFFLHCVTFFQEGLFLTSGRWWRNPLLSTTHLPVVFPMLWVSINYYRGQNNPLPYITQILWRRDVAFRNFIQLDGAKLEDFFLFDLKSGFLEYLWWKCWPPCIFLSETANSRGWVAALSFLPSEEYLSLCSHNPLFALLHFTLFPVLAVGSWSYWKFDSRVIDPCNSQARPTHHHFQQLPICLL